MSIPARNKLWALASTPENLRLCEQYPRSRADSDHCLIIASERPPGAVEMNDELLGLIPPDEWAWVLNEGRKIRLEEARDDPKELKEAIDAFLQRFEKGLLAARAEGKRSEQEEKTGTDGAAAGSGAR